MGKRRRSRRVRVGDVYIGGDSPITVQSMTTVKTRDAEGCIEQINELSGAGADIVRVAVPDRESAYALRRIRREVNVPLVADIHFDYKLAILSAPYVDKIRFNPGNAGGADKVRQIVKAARENGISLRIGVNSGSIEAEFRGMPVEEGLFNSAMKALRLVESLDFRDIVLSLKSSNFEEMIGANERIAKACDYPLHLGVTEAGPLTQSLIRSSLGIGTLLREGIGDTIRISISDNPLKEVAAGRELLSSLGLRKGVKIVSCPTCARAEIDVIKLAAKVEEALSGVKEDITVAVMGCPVNGPGEARHADVGVAGGLGQGILFRKDKIIDRVSPDRIVERLVEEVNRIVEERRR